MGAIFTSPGRTVGAGVVLLIVIVVVIGAVTGQMTRIDHAWGTFVMRWLHVLSGVLWIGLLWYLNFVQVPTMPSIPAENRVAISKYIATIPYATAPGCQLEAIGTNRSLKPKWMSL